MKFSSEASIAVLEYAQIREKESRDFYKACLAKAAIAGTQEILKGLVADEERHYAIVTDLIKNARDKAKTAKVDTTKPVSAKTVLEKAFPHTMTVDKTFAVESATVGEMLSKALANEKESYTNYMKAAKDADENELKDIYTFLAEEEKKHYTIIDNLADYLDDPGNWLYNEENILFQL